MEKKLTEAEAKKLSSKKGLLALLSMKNDLPFNIFLFCPKNCEYDSSRIIKIIKTKGEKETMLNKNKITHRYINRQSAIF